MPIICSFRGIKITLNYNDHMPPHFHAYYGEYECCIDINEIEKIHGDMPNKQLKMLLGGRQCIKKNWKKIGIWQGKNKNYLKLNH